MVRTRPVRVTGRTLAMDILRRVRSDGAYAELVLSAALERSALPDNDKALATQLVYGVLRNLTYIDWHVSRVARRPIDSLEPRIADALRIGAYQLLFLDRIPPYAAVDESVQMVPKRAAGLVNAVLRRIPQGMSGRLEPEGKDPLEVASIRWSHPRWLLDSWARDYGVETAVAIAQANQTPPELVVRINTNRTDMAAMLTELESLKAMPTHYAPNGLVLARTNKIVHLPSFAEGRIIVQSEASQIVGELVGAKSGEKVLDLCAAPGGKATFLMAQVGEKGKVFAVDLHPRRLRLLRGNMKRLGYDNASVMQIDATDPVGLGNHNGQFDRVLVDAPCTSLGTLAKNPEVRWRIKPEDPNRLAKTQLSIIKNAANQVKPGGVLVYSVCTFTAAETRKLVESFQRIRRDFVLDDLRKEFSPRYDDFLQEDGTFLSLPHKTGTEGFFAARFVRKELA